jgi:uncharacterized protein
MTFVVAIQLLALGSFAGFMAGLLGIGGGLLMVPFLTLVLHDLGAAPGMDVKMAIATAMSTIVFTSISSVRAHHARGNVRWDIVARLAPGIVLGGLAAGAGIFAQATGATLALFFGVFVCFSATQMVLDRKPRPSRPLPGTLGMLGAGTGIGLVAGLLGAGGAFMATPFMLWCNVPIHHVVATSSAIGFPGAVAATAGYVVSGWHLPAAVPGALGYLHLPTLSIVSLASMLCAPGGAKAAQRLNTLQLKRVFAGLLYGLGLFMLHKAWASWH